MSDSELDVENNPNNFALSRASRKNNSNTQNGYKTKNSTQIDNIILETEIKRGHNISFYLNHFDKVIRQKSKNIYNKIHGSGAHLQFIAENSAEINTLLSSSNMEPIEQLKSDNEVLRSQMVAIQQTNHCLNETISQLNATIQLLRAELSDIRHNLISQHVINTNVSTNEWVQVDGSTPSSSNSCPISPNSSRSSTQITGAPASTTNDQTFANLVRTNAPTINKQASNPKQPTFKFSKTITPIICSDLNSETKRNLMAVMNQSFGKKTLMINSSSNSIKINSDTAETRIQVIEVLKQSQFQFHTFCPDFERRVDIVICGLPYDDELFNQESILIAVRSWGYSPISARMINRPRNNNENNSQMVNWHVSLPHNTLVDDLFGKQIIHQCVVSVQLLKKRPIAQCYRCLQFHHTASHCFKQQKCLICAGEHKAGECTKPKNEKPTCINCKGDHVATNLKKCSYFLDIAERSKLARDTNNKSIAENIVELIQSKTQPKRKQPKQVQSKNGGDTMLPSSTPAKLPNTTKKRGNKSKSTNESQSTGSTKSSTKPNQKNQPDQSLHRLLSELIMQQKLLLQRLDNAI